MRDLIAPRLAKWPFFSGDILLLGLAWFVYSRSATPLGAWEMAIYFACIAVGAALSSLPFVLEYRAVMKLAETAGLTSVVDQVQNLDRLAAQISGATGRWQEAQAQADKTASAAREIADRMVGEVQAFSEFMQRANDSEKGTLRLEVEKLRRAEGEWVHVLVRVLDHIYALHLGAVRSGQPGLIEQITNFQNACRDSARRVGLTPFAAGPAEPFDEQRHQVVEGEAKPEAGAVVTETVAAGYTFQGRMLRPALVRVQQVEPEPTPDPEKPAHPDAELEAAQSSLPLETAGPNP
jgi:molecular chaperone GrpE (heat shock protein)